MTNKTVTCFIGTEEDKKEQDLRAARGGADCITGRNPDTNGALPRY